MKKNWIIKTEKDLNPLVDQLIKQHIKRRKKTGASVITLHGNLGSGKTTLTQILGKRLGITEAINSPTFVIIKYYDLKQNTWKRLIHIDAYRLDGEPTESMQFEELFADTDNLIIIEWPEYIQSLIPSKHSQVKIEILKDNKRLIEVDSV